jgi:hypothetical protein
MCVARSVEAEIVSFFADLKAECRIEPMRDRQIGDNQVKIVHRVDAEFPGTARRCAHRMNATSCYD